jgi:hypothetical protein
MSVVAIHLTHMSTDDAEPVAVPPDEPATKRKPPARPRPTGPPKSVIAEQERIKLLHENVTRVAQSVCGPDVKLDEQLVASLGFIADHLLNRLVPQTLQMQRISERSRVQAIDAVTALQMLAPPPHNATESMPPSLASDVINQAALQIGKGSEQEPLLEALIRERVLA